MTMEPMEEKLRRAMRREEPSGEFTARVLARVGKEKQHQPWWRDWFVTPGLRRATAVVLCVLFGGGVIYQHEQARRHAEGEAAREQVMLALRIAGTKVKLAQDRVQQMSERNTRRN